MEKVKEMVTGKTKEERHAEREADRATAGIGTSSYTNVGATTGAAGAPGIAGPVAPASGAAGAPGEYGAPLAAGAGAATETRYAEGEKQYGTTATTGAATTGVAAPDTCAQEVFTKVEDRPVVKERVQQVVEHRPVEKEFVVETRATGAEREAGVGEVEHLGTQERVVGGAGLGAGERVVRE